MVSQAVWFLKNYLHKIWVRATSFAILAVLTVALAQVASRFLPTEWTDLVEANAVDALLGILASSMLAVTTFSLSIAVSAFAAAANTTTPRATALLQEDTTTQNVLATFLGAFLFGLVGMVALKAGYYSQSGLLVLHVATAAVITLVVIVLLRWIGHLMTFGRVEDTLDRVEDAAVAAIERRIRNPWMGGVPRTKSPPQDAYAVYSKTTGYVQHIDMIALSEQAEALGIRLWISAVPGTFVHTSDPLFHMEGGEIGDADLTELCKGVTIERQRTFDQDPRFGLIVMSEIAARALSPSVNDPGTAIGVIGRLVRVLSNWQRDVDAEIAFPRIIVPGLQADELLEHSFRSIARDGAGMAEVQIRLQKALTALARGDADTFGEPARDLARDALQRAEDAGLRHDEMAELRKASML